MTRCGMICLIALMAVSLAGLIVCSVRQQRSDPSGTARMIRSRKGAANSGRLETVTGEPVAFRTAELRWKCFCASQDLRLADFEELYFGGTNESAANIERFHKKELAYIIMDQAIEAGAIEYERSDGVLRAKVKILLPEVKRDEK